MTIERIYADGQETFGTFVHSASIIKCDVSSLPSLIVELKVEAIMYFVVFQRDVVLVDDVPARITLLCLSLMRDTNHFFKTIFSGLVPVCTAINFFKSPILSDGLHLMRTFLPRRSLTVISIIVAAWVSADLWRYHYVLHSVILRK